MATSQQLIQAAGGLPGQARQVLAQVAALEAPDLATRLASPVLNHGPAGDGVPLVLQGPVHPLQLTAAGRGDPGLLQGQLQQVPGGYRLLAVLSRLRRDGSALDHQGGVCGVEEPAGITEDPGADPATFLRLLHGLLRDV